jgi:hypothetical protein
MDPWIYQRWDEVTRQTKTSGYTRGGIRWSDKHRPLDIPEVGSGDQTNTDLWIYQKWYQVTRQTGTPGYTRSGIKRPDKHGPLNIPEVGSDKHGSLDITEVGSGLGKHRPLDIPEVGSGDQTNTDPWIYQRWDQVTRQIQNPGYTRHPWIYQRWD